MLLVTRATALPPFGAIPANALLESQSSVTVQRAAGSSNPTNFRRLALHYSKARRALWTCLNAWEREFYGLQPGSDPSKLVETLKELHRIHGELSRRLDGLHIPRERERADRGWFANVTRHDTAHSVDKIIDHSLHNLRSFSDSLRQAVSLTQSYATMRHFALAAEQKEQTERFQNGFQLARQSCSFPL